MKQNFVLSVAIANALLHAYQKLGLMNAMSPAGGTRFRGSAHPKLPACGRAPGVARGLRKTQRPLRIGRPAIKYAVSTKYA